jgi:hypothetical protein
MRRQIVIAAIALQSLECSVNSNPRREASASLMPPAETRSGELAIAPEVLPLLWQMLGDAGFGFRHTEQAGFIVRKPGGQLTLVRWPDAGEPDTSRWAGKLPDGAIAIVHTHPNWEPLPSKIDIRTAQRSHLPVYVITRNEISKTLGGSPQIVLSGDWSAVARLACAGQRPLCSGDQSSVATLAQILRQSSLGLVRFR